MKKFNMINTDGSVERVTSHELAKRLVALKKEDKDGIVKIQMKNTSSIWLGGSHTDYMVSINCVTTHKKEIKIGRIDRNKVDLDDLTIPIMDAIEEKYWML